MAGRLSRGYSTLHRGQPVTSLLLPPLAYTNSNASGPFCAIYQGPSVRHYALSIKDLLQQLKEERRAEQGKEEKGEQTKDNEAEETEQQQQQLKKKPRIPSKVRVKGEEDEEGWEGAKDEEEERQLDVSLRELNLGEGGEGSEGKEGEEPATKGETDAEADRMERILLSDYSPVIGRKILQKLTERYPDTPPDEQDTLFQRIMVGEYQKIQDLKTRKPTAELGHAKLRIEDLKYFYLMNKRMRQWILHLKTPRGYFNTQGRWEPRNRFPTYYELIKDTDMDNSQVLMQAFLKEKEKPLPKQFEGVYRFGVTEEELKEVGASETIREFLSFRHAFRKERNSELIRQSREKFGRHMGDTGSSELQVAALTIKIRSMNEYLKKNHKNQVYKRHLHKMIDRRKRLLQYLKKQNAETYFKLLMDIGLRDTVFIKINRKSYK